MNISRVIALKNMKKTLIITIIIHLITQSFAQSKQDEIQANIYATLAIKIMDESGKFDEAIELLEKAIQLDSTRIEYPYEIAYALYSQKKYGESIVILEQMIDRKDVTVQHFQLLGNCYDYLKQPKKALEIYQKGLTKFPKSGKLYLEQGIVEYYQGKYNNAIALWEKGVEIDPDFSSNYFWLGNIFSKTDERIWAILYGEIFIHLERNTERTTKMSKILYDTYQQSIQLNSDSSFSVHFTKKILLEVDTTKELKLPFPLVYASYMVMANAFDNEHKDTNSLASLNYLRKNFIHLWYDQKKDKDYPNILFDYQKKLLDAGHFEAFNYWFLMKGNEDEFVKWYKQNETKFNDFANWYFENPIKINEQNYFSRLKF